LERHCFRLWLPCLQAMAEYILVRSVMCSTLASLALLADNGADDQMMTETEGILQPGWETDDLDLHFISS
jgi:hypothetical protein